MIHAAQPQAAPSHALIQELGTAHDQLRAAMSLLEVETAKPVPDMAAVATIRLRLAQASRRRAGVIDTLVATEARQRTGAALAQLLALQDSVRRARAASTAHIARWTPAALEKDWRDYCAASFVLRRAMRQQIELEHRVLIAPQLSGGVA